MAFLILRTKPLPQAAARAAGLVDTPKAACYSAARPPGAAFKEAPLPVHIIVTAKQVIDPETPASALHISADGLRMEPPANVAPVVNGFDENAVEAALRIKEAEGGKITVLSVGNRFALDVMKKPLSMGGDELILMQDEAFETLDAYGTARVLAAAIGKIGEFDLVLCGRQASDFDQSTVPLALAELLELPCVTLARRVEVKGAMVMVDRSIAGGHETVEAPLPTVVTVSNELGQPRYPTLRGIMTASRKQPVIWSSSDLGLAAESLRSRVETLELFIPVQERVCTFIDAETDEEKGRLLAQQLRDAKLI